MTSPLLKLPNTFRAFYGPFTHLNESQKKAILPILQGKDFILQAATGSGKTEAVLAPCIEALIQSGSKGSVIYIVPTRALAVDLLRRLTPVFQRLSLRLGIRTGDMKRWGGANPHMLLITPESLDVMLGSRNQDVRHFVKRVRSVVIDEVHYAMYDYRGQQLVYLLNRLERRLTKPLQKIALSATISDIEAVIHFFKFRKDAVRLLSAVDREIVPHFVCLKNEEHELVALLNDLFQEWNYRKILIFVNNRGACDRIFSLLNEQGRFKGVTELHYSNVSSKERRKVEKRFQNRDHALCVATSTLELGIDIGNVDCVLLYEPPDSVSTFLQRIGRGNRRLKHVDFWGICRGAQPGKQLLRFLALLRLAREGAIEAPFPKTLYSVLIQQILSCLYEKRELSLKALQNLFPHETKTISLLFNQMARQKWLRETSVPGIFRGGWRYRDWLLDYKIWSNFPETEEDYSLIVSKKTIADIPATVVRQLEPGDRVCLTGKRLEITRIINTKEQKCLQAQPATGGDDKEIYWVGSGFLASYEVAQAIKTLLDEAHTVIQNPDWGLFTRTRRLFNEKMELKKKIVSLTNGIEVHRKPDGHYRYGTFLGSVGNVILHTSILHSLGKEIDDFTLSFDETGLDSSHWIDFQKLPLPVSKEEFHHWLKKHFRALQALVSLNAFARFLPKPMLVEELSGFLFDPRVCHAFKDYLKHPSEVKSGDAKLLEGAFSLSPAPPSLLEQKVSGDSLLVREKRRYLKEESGEAPLSSFLYPEIFKNEKPLTGKIVGEFIRHNQCERRLCLNYVSKDQRPPRSTVVDSETSAYRIKQGQSHKQNTITFLKTKCDELVTIKDRDVRGASLSLATRFTLSLNQIERLIQQVLEDPKKTFILTGAVLISPNLFGGSRAKRRDAVAMPDLIRISSGKKGPILEMGDIRHSSSPNYSQKWQISFYLFIMKELLSRKSQPLSIEGLAKVSPQGVLFTRPIRGGEETPVQNTFNLKAYEASFPELLRNMVQITLKSSREASFRLESHCVTCPYFQHCYTEALAARDILFLPQLTRGVFQTLSHLSIGTIKLARDRYSNNGDQSDKDDLSPQKQDYLNKISTALTDNTLIQRSGKSRLFPANISVGIFFNIVEDPLTGLPRGFSCQAWNRFGDVGPCYIQELISGEELPLAWKSFSDHLLKLWKESIDEECGPHLFYFGKRTWSIFKEWCFRSELEFLTRIEPPFQSDLAKIVSTHFYVPAPGRLTLFSLAHVLGLSPKPKAPESFFHGDPVSVIFPNDYSDAQKQRERESLALNLSLQIKIWQRIWPTLEGEWEQKYRGPSALNKESLQSASIHFIESEKRLREEDIASLQACALEERLARCRAMGPLLYFDAVLDEEGNFLYGFKLQSNLESSKFREGDFLKLSPIGAADIQSGFSVILILYDRNSGKVWLSLRGRDLSFCKSTEYSLEEDATDWNSHKLMHAVNTVFSEDSPHTLAQLFSTNVRPSKENSDLSWLEKFLQTTASKAGLNPAQERALELPFRSPIGLVEGPPGTGKTHLLAWSLIALIQKASEEGKPLRIAISALTHQAIDQVLRKITEIIHSQGFHDFPGQCVKWGRWEQNNEKEYLKIKTLENREQLSEYPFLLLGATGFGLYQLFEGKKGNFPQFFDWIIFDEASQILVPQALLSLLYGKGNFLFFGDIQQLPPIVLGNSAKHHPFQSVCRSVLSNLLDSYPARYHVRLDRTYRMNKEICRFPSNLWYDGELRPAEENADLRLALHSFQEEDILDQVLNPERPVTLLLTKHRGCHQKSEVEIKVVTELARRVMLRHGLRPDQLALISPHRTQNNAISKSMESIPGMEGGPLPLIDTVERVQGAERDLILFSLTTSGPDHIESAFLNNPNRFNVVITRAKKKLIIVGSEIFFSNVARKEDALEANRCFKMFLDYCRKNNSLFFLPEEE